MPGRSSDVLVLGGGMAGLSAVRLLASRGVRVTLLEARERLGGRSFTEYVADWPTPIELGAEFVHGRPAELLELVSSAGLALETAESPHFWRSGEDYVPAEEFDSGFQEELALNRFAKTDCSAADFLSSGRLPPESARRLGAFIEGFHAATLERVSMRSVAEQMSGDDDAQARIRGGYARLVEFLERSAVTSGARLVRGARALSVDWKPRSVSVRTTAGEWQASALVVALPLAVLKAEPALGGLPIASFSPRVQAALAGLEMGQAQRVVLRLREPVWSRSSLPAGAFVHRVEAPFPTLWLHPDETTPQVTLWCGGPRAERLTKLGSDAIAGDAVRSLAAAFDTSSEAAERLVAGRHLHVFGADACSRGAYPYALVGAELAGAFEPLESTLFFAGDFTDAKELGTVGSAVSSGVAAAERVLDALG